MNCLLFARLLARAALCLAAVWLGAAAQAQPTPAGPKPAQPTPAGGAPAPLSTAKLLQQAYELSQRAKTIDDFSAVAEACERALGGSTDEKIRKYASELAAWGYNRRGEAFAEQASALINQGEERKANEFDTLALDDFQAAVKFDPLKWKARQNRGVSFALHGRFEEALTDFDEVIKQNPTYANAWFNRGEIFVTQGKLDDALVNYQEAVKLAPNDVGYLMARGMILRRQGKLRDAAADIQAVLRQKPEHPVALAERGDILAEMGNWRESADAYRLAIKFNPQLGRAYRGVAWLMATCPDERFRNPELAVQTARKAAELADEDDFLTLEALAAALAITGKFPEAAAAQERALRVAPAEKAEAAKARLELYQSKQTYLEPQQSARRTGDPIK